MLVQILKGKLHMACVTGACAEYEGSLSVDAELLELAGIMPYERVLCSNLNNGERFETYVIPAPRGSRQVVLNGPAARLGRPGHRLVVMNFGFVAAARARKHAPKCVVLDEHNNPVSRRAGASGSGAPGARRAGSVRRSSRGK